MSRSAISTYQSVQKETMGGRDLEAHVLFKAMAKLQECQNTWEEPGLTIRLDEALRYNQRLWTFFQAELTDENNSLPVALKQDLLNLAKFVDRHTFGVMANPASSKLDVLININRNIAEGLSGNAG